MAIDLQQFLQLFFEESQANSLILQDGLRAFVEGSPSSATLDPVVRAVHSIKSASGAFGFEDVCAVAQAIENVLRQVEKGNATMTPARTGVCVDAAVVLAELLQLRQIGKCADEAWVANEVSALEACYPDADIPDNSCTNSR
jgi:two-component system, chemotaxis family, sensor histidine kinase and response regulator WspE